MRRRWRESSVGRCASCRKLTIEISIGDKEEKVIKKHSLLGLTVLTLRCFTQGILEPTKRLSEGKCIIQ